MQVRFESRVAEGRLIEDTAIRRVGFVMRRLSWLAPRVRVVLTDENGVRGGVDKRCRVTVQRYAGKPVAATALARTWQAALDLALGRALQSLLRNWRRRQQRRRPMMRALHGH